MKKDFTVGLYQGLLEVFITHGYSFQTVVDYVLKPAERVTLLRHDVDGQAWKLTGFARIQHELGISGTYYFRMVRGRRQHHASH